MRKKTVLPISYSRRQPGAPPAGERAEIEQQTRRDLSAAEKNARIKAINQRLAVRMGRAKRGRTIISEAELGEDNQ